MQSQVALQLHGSGGAGGGVPLQCSEHELRPYVLAGPAAAVARCDREFGNGDELKRLGFITPAARVTLDPASRAAAGVPAAAAYFAFAHPPTGIAALSEERIEELTESGLAEPWLHFLVLGGFCYFNDRCELLAVNAITAPGGGNEDPGAAHPEMRTRLSFDGPLPVDGPARERYCLRAPETATGGVTRRVALGARALRRTCTVAVRARACAERALGDVTNGTRVAKIASATGF